MTRRRLAFPVAAVLLVGIVLVPLDAVAQGKDTAPGQQPPSNSALPSIAGTAQAGQALTAGTGEWSGASQIAYSYEWQRCDTSGGGCAPLPGATDSTYGLSDAEVGSTIRVVVTASNRNGAASATSDATTVVAPVPAPASAPEPSPPTTTTTTTQTTTTPTATTTSSAPSGTLRFDYDYSTGDLSQWGSKQDDTTTSPNPDAAGFEWGHDSIAPMSDVSGYAGKFTLPAWGSGVAAFVNKTDEYPLQHPDEYYGLSYYFPSGGAEPQTSTGVMLWQKGKSAPGDPMFGSSEPVMLTWRGANTNRYEDVELVIQSGAFSCTTCLSQYFSGETANDFAPYGVDPRYPGSTNPFPAGGFVVIPHSMFAYNTWFHLIIHIHHSTGTDGAVEAWAKRAGDASWTKTVQLTTGFPTLEWLAAAGPDSIAPYPKYDNVGAYTGPLPSPGISLYNGIYCAGSTSSVVAAAMKENAP